jgi:hypothetical protein
MPQRVSRRPLTAEALVRSQASPYLIYGGLSGTRTGFYLENLVPPVSNIPPMLHTHIYPITTVAV